MCSKVMYTIAAAVVYLYSAASAQASVWFLPDWQDAGQDQEIKMDINKDTKWCEKEGFTYYSSGSCPAYYKQTTCSRDKKYLKCDALGWCKDNGYNTTSCSIPKYLDQKCPNGLAQYKTCKEDTPRACKELGYKNTCPSGQKLHASSGRCSYNNSYGTCCAPKGCPANTSLSGSYGSAGSNDGCGYACYYTCNMNCPSGTSTSNPGGCGGSTRNGCNTKTCYYPYQSCCSPTCSDDWSSCSCGSYTISDGCGGTCRRCSSCCNSSSYNWCSVHSTCHGNCCTDGSIQSCDPQCGGSGCGGGGGGGSSAPTEGRYGVWVGNFVCWPCASGSGICLVQDVDVYCSTTGAFICRRQGYRSSSKTWSSKSACEAEYRSNIKSGFGAGQRYDTQTGSCSTCAYW